MRSRPKGPRRHAAVPLASSARLSPLAPSSSSRHGASRLGQPSPPAPAAPAPAPSGASADNPVRRLEQRIVELETRLAAQEKRAAEEKKAEDKRAAEEKKAEEKKAEEPPKAAEPFAFGDFSWSPANYGASDRPLSWGPFTGELRVDVAYHYDFSNPKDHTISGSSEVFRSNEFQLTQLGLGGDFLYKNVQARLMTQFGMYSQTTPRNDASAGIGQWDLDTALRYLAEAYGGYHWDVHARHQRRCRHLRFLYRPLQLLQLRQLDVSALVRLVEHAVVLQRRARPVSSQATS